MRRRFLIFLTLVIVLVALFHIAGGWYFSGILETDALVPQPPSRDFGVVATGVTEDTVTLAGSDETISEPGRFGLWWEGGYAQVDAILALGEDGSAQRVFIPISGSPPTCQAPGDPGCVDLDLESVAYDNPDQTGVAVSDVTYQSPLGTMEAWQTSPAGADASSVWAIQIHGWRTDRREALRTLRAFDEAGITSLVVEYRNDPGAPPDPTGYYRFGRSEWEDVDSAVTYALANGAEAIVLVGYSTGAAAVMSWLERSDQTDVAAGIILDSPNIDFGRAVKSEAAERTLVGPIPLPASLTAVAMWIADLRFDVGWDEINYSEQRIDIPALVFQGSEDGTIPPSVAADLAAANPQLVTLIETAADHVQSWNEDPARYERILVEFLGDLSGT